MEKYFFTNNKSGYKTNENWLKKNNVELYNKIINYCKINSILSNISFKEKIYLFINKLSKIPICPSCKKPVKFNDSLNKGYNNYCSISCLNKSKEHKDKIIINNLVRYNCKSINQLELVKIKKKNTLQKNYGVDNPMKDNKIKENQINSILNNYGVNNPMKISKVINDRKIKIENGEEFNIVRMLKRIDISNNIKYIKHNYKNNIYFWCNECKKEFEINSNLLTSRIANNTKICINCNKNKSYSTIQKSIEGFLKSIKIKIKTKDRKILNGKEIDIYLPDYKLGIEIDGLYWHSDKYKDKNYHLNKTNNCEKQNIELIHIFEDEWINNQEIVKSIIKSKLIMFDKIINANDCKVIEINNKISSEFIKNNSINDNIKSTIKLGLFYNAELVSVLLLNKTDTNNYKIINYCNKININVSNSLKKLLDYFIKKYDSNSIIVYIDRRYSQSGEYKKINFKFKGYSKPSFYFFKPGEIKKFKIKTKDRNLLKIYDCGNIIMQQPVAQFN